MILAYEIYFTAKVKANYGIAIYPQRFYHMAETIAYNYLKVV